MRILTLLLLFLAAPAFAQHDDHQGYSEDEHAVYMLADQFTEAIFAADRSTVEAILSPDALILESGGIETRDEYFGHHFGADGEFLGAMTRELLDRTVQIHGDVAWVSSQARLHGQVGDRDLDFTSAELLVLRRTPEGWRVAAVHWSH